MEHVSPVMSLKEFARLNHIRHLTTAPYHPSSNGLAERAGQTFKLGMKKQTNGTIQTKLSRFCSIIGWYQMPQLVFPRLN